mgnify:CR=1 FL=1
MTVNLGFQFNAAQVEPNKPIEVIPTDWYNAVIKSSSAKPAKSGEGSGFAELVIEVIDGPYKGAVVFDRLNFWNPNPATVEIAQRTLSSICRATGVMQVEQTAPLHNIPMCVRVVKKPAGPDKDGVHRDESNDVKGYAPYGTKQTNTAAAAPAGPSFGASPGGAAPAFGAPPAGAQPGGFPALPAGQPAAPGFGGFPAPGQQPPAAAPSFAPPGGFTPPATPGGFPAPGGPAPWGG